MGALARLVGGFPPRRTVRQRLTLLYGGLFAVCGAGVLTLTYFLVRRAVAPAGNVNVFRYSRPTGDPAAAGGRPPPLGTEAERVVANAEQALAEQRRDVLRQLLAQSGIALAVMAVLALALGWWVAGRVLRRLRDGPGDLRDQPAPAHRSAGPGRRAEGTRRHLRRVARPLGVVLRRSITPCRVTGHRGLAERSVVNLVDNAIRHIIPGGWVHVSCGSAQLTVTNTGPAVPEADVDRLFQPFQRGGRARTGHGPGLGLSIVQAIAAAHAAHAAHVTATPRPDGGLTVAVVFADPDDLPAPAPQAASVVTHARRKRSHLRRRDLRAGR